MHPAMQSALLPEAHKLPQCDGASSQLLHEGMKLRPQPMT